MNLLERIAHVKAVVERSLFNNGAPPLIRGFGRADEDDDEDEDEDVQLAQPAVRSETHERAARLARENARRGSEERQRFIDQHRRAKTRLPSRLTMPTAPPYVPVKYGNQAVYDLSRAVGFPTYDAHPPSLNGQFIPQSLQLQPHEAIHPPTPPRTSRHTPLRPESSPFNRQAPLPPTPPSFAHNDIPSLWDSSLLNGSPAHTYGNAFAQNPFGQHYVNPFVRPDTADRSNVLPPAHGVLITPKAALFALERELQEARRAATGREPLSGPHPPNQVGGREGDGNRRHSRPGGRKKRKGRGRGGPRSGPGPGSDGPFGEY